MRAFIGLWTAAMLLTAGFGAAGTSPERLIRVIYADAYGAAQVLDGRASLAAQWTEDALRAVWAPLPSVVGNKPWIPDAHTARSASSVH